MNTRLRSVAALAALAIALEVPSCGKPVGEQPNIKPLHPTKVAPSAEGTPINPPRPTKDDRKRKVEFIVTFWPKDAEVSVRWQVDNKAETVIWSGGKWDKWTYAGTSGTMATIEVQGTTEGTDWITCMIKVDGQYIHAPANEWTPYAHVQRGFVCEAATIIP